ncbi:hypothetical protein [Streptomyces marianii]|uniref:Uncharacterized protein n=1 Tax=Streptomyces marianii TaxID=1817406 RepID=A0A5R9DX54_9ACTN|nr:hypothetical protein [Streptomyces marianii]TLQ42188.1 hypothetical protein FEF34_02120 [Streptomyces marianii]
MAAARENAHWDKRTVWQEMVKSFTKGDFTYEWPLGDGRIYTFFVGGIDFAKVPKRNITGVEFTAQHRELPRATKDSVRTETSARDSDTAFLGGNGAALTDDGPDPTPTDPSDPPTSPGPDPTKPGNGDTGGSGGVTPPANRPDPDGGLATPDRAPRSV